MTDPRFLSGQVLLAMPGIGDVRFDHAVIVMCAHDEAGALGIGIGHVLDGISLHKLLDQLGIDPGVAPDVPVHFGGPVEPARGFVLHSTDWGGEGTIQAGAFALTSTQDALKAIARGAGPSRWLVALGYAGWSAGQLEQEMKDNAWITLPVDERILFEMPLEDRWHAVWRHLGVDPVRMSHVAGHA